MVSNLAICDLNLAILGLISPLRLISVRLISVGQISGKSRLVVVSMMAALGVQMLGSAINLSKRDLFAGGRGAAIMPPAINLAINLEI